MIWFKAIPLKDMPPEGSIAIWYQGAQVALYSLGQKLYATQNVCPHKQVAVLARGLLGEQKGEPKIACPLHKRTFHLETGKGLSDPQYCLQTFRVKVENGFIFIELPENPQEIYGTCKPNSLLLKKTKLLN